MRTSEVTIFRQRGVVVVLTAVSMVALIAMAGLALDMGHALLNKTRLQNSLDAAVLAAAQILDATGNPTVAASDGLAVFNLNTAGAGNGELLAANLVPTFQFSDTLYPFVSCDPGCAAPQYVRAAVGTYALDAFLIQVIGINQKTVGASAVAGPSPTLIAEACDLAPMLVCADPTEDADISDGDFFGYGFNDLVVLKNGPPPQAPGPGNFKLVRFDGGPGAKEVREGMAGGYDGCARANDAVTTETGNLPGPVAMGLNTRFNEYFGPMNGTENYYPPDVNDSEVVPALSYKEMAVDDWQIVDAATETVVITVDDITAWDYPFYQMKMAIPSYTNPPPPDGSGAYDRRMLTIPMGDCMADPACTGTCDIPLLGFGCFFLLQKAKIKGNEAEVYGQFVDGCGAYGAPGPDPGSGPGPYIIQLYEDVGSLDS